MKEFFFGWLIKPAYLQTPIDGMVATAELIVLFFLGAIIWAAVTAVKDRGDK